MKTDNLNESGLSRVRQHIAAHDCGIITAWRYAPDCGKGKPYTRSEKNQRNGSLRTKLAAAGYGLTSGLGAFVENGVEVNENVFFVVDRQDIGTLKNDLVKLGEEFEQDSILWLPKSSSEKVDAYLIVTNDCDDTKPRGLTVKLGNFFFSGEASGGIFTRINGRKFTFGEMDDLANVTEHRSWSGRMMDQAVADQPWWAVRTKEMSLLEFYTTMANRSELLSEAKKFTSYKSDNLTSKMWILPDGVAVALDQWHYRWILANKDRVAKFGLDVTKLPDDEDVVRNAALQKGFFRVNYEHSNGHLVIEGIKMKLSKKIKDAAFMLVMENLRSIDRATLNLMDESIKHLVWNKTVTLFTFSDPGEKLDEFEKVFP